jgi:uncharacterized membrane protein
MKNIATAAFMLIALAAGTHTVYADNAVHEDLQGIWRAEVVSVISETSTLVPGTSVTTPIQTLDARILEGPRAGNIVRVENDFLSLSPGERFFLNYLITVEGRELYLVSDADRRMPLLALVIFFSIIVIAFGGKQGVRSLLAMAGSLFVIAYALVPALLAGFPPVITATVVSGVILFFAIFLTHGWNRESAVAFAGTSLAVALTGLIAWASVVATELSGFASDESVFLNMKTDGQLDIAGLLLGGIIIGILGVLDDIAVTQVAIVRELLSAGGSLSPREVYQRAIRVGREHVGALVNTLALAYTGASLPLLLLFHGSAAPAGIILNGELFATEIVRTVVGSLGLVFAVPITTFLAVITLKGRPLAPGSHSHHHHHHGGHIH